jgi:ubiquinone/menaquinone biosynthesis C-methylase UbiE
MNYKAKKHYKDKEVAGKYDEERFRGLKGYLTDNREKNIIYKAINKAGIKPPATVLDLPCGTGRLSLFLAGKGFEVEGIDISEEMVDRAAEKVRGQSYGSVIRLGVGDAESLPLKDNSVDIAVSLRLFGHLPPENRLRVLRELSRVSKGFLAVAYYHKRSVQGLIRKKMRARKDIPWYPVDMKQIDRELADAGLERMGKVFLIPYVSETVIITAKNVSNRS